MTSFPSIDDVLHGNRLTPEQRATLLSAEQAANRALKVHDGLTEWEHLGPHHEVHQAISEILDQILEVKHAEILSKTSYPNPTVDVITGAPGSGKSHLWHRLSPNRRNDVMYLCADVIKGLFKEKAKQHVLLQDDDKWQNDSFIHRLTAKVSWKLFDLAKVQRIDMVLEMLGQNIEEDADMCIDLANQYGYEVSLHHVATSTRKAIENAIHRYFGEGQEGRHISLTKIASIQEKLLDAFEHIEARIRKSAPDVAVLAYDNRERTMIPIYANDGKTTTGALDSHIFLDLHSPEGLWFKGENHTSDVLIFSKDEQGEWIVATITRAKPPFQDKYAFPGGFINTSAEPGNVFTLDVETPEQAARREFSEETLLSLDPHLPLQKIGVYDHPLRDPRNNKEGWIVNHVFAGFLDHPALLHPADDASSASWVKVKDLLKKKQLMAFDHQAILKDTLKMLNIPVAAPKRTRALRI